jgi:ribose 5-phosphate isomerase
MASKQEIEIVINAKGEVTFQVKGVKGGACLTETKFLEQALGGEAAIVDQQKTSEFYEGNEGYVSTWQGTGEDGGD